MPEIGGHVRRMIDEVVRASRLPTVIEELDAHIAVNSDDPITDLVQVVDERAVLRLKGQRNNRDQLWAHLARCDRSGCG